MISKFKFTFCVLFSWILQHACAKRNAHLKCSRSLTEHLNLTFSGLLLGLHICDCSLGQASCVGANGISDGS